MLGDGHPDTLSAPVNLALTLRDRGKCAEAEALQPQAHASTVSNAPTRVY